MKEINAVIFRDRGVEFTIDRSTYDRREAYDREATRQQAIHAAERCLAAWVWLALLGDAAGAERYWGHLTELAGVILPRSS